MSEEAVSSAGMPRTEPGAGFTRFETGALLVLCLVTIPAIDFLFYPKTLDDAFITYRYAEHWADGYGLGAWNKEGPRVEGYTSFLWMAGLSAAHKMGLDVQTVSKLTGILSHSLLCLLCFGLSFRLKHSPTLATAFLLAGAGVTLYLPLSWYATSGMESAAFALLTAGVLFAPYWGNRISVRLLFFCGFILLLFRPEAPLILMAGFGGVWLAHRHDDSRMREVYWSAVVLLAVWMGQLLFRRLFFHDWFPNAYWAKLGGQGMGHIALGGQYLRGWAGVHGLLLTAAFFSLLDFRQKRYVLTCVVILFCIAYGVYVVYAGGDNPTAFPYWRHFVHIIAPLMLIAGLGIASLSGRHRYIALGVMLLAVAATDGLAWRYAWPGGKRPMPASLISWSEYPSLRVAEPDPYYRWLDKMSDDHTVIASSLGGELPYVVDAIHIDALGLNTPYIAHHGTFEPGGPVDAKTDMAWVVEQQPDIIEGYLPASWIIEQKDPERFLRWGRKKMNLELLTSSRFQDDYVFIQNGPYTTLDRALFFRRAFWETHPHRAELEAIPIAETPLGAFRK